MFVRSSSVSTIGSHLTRTIGCCLAALVVPVGLVTGVVGGAPAAHATTTTTPTTTTFTYPQTGSFVAPGPGTLTMTATGGSGHSGIDTVFSASGGAPLYGGSGGAGGAGEVVTEILAVTTGEQFDAYPGAAAGGPGGVQQVAGIATYPDANLGGGSGGVGPTRGGVGGGGGAATAVVNHNSGTFQVVAAGGGGGGGGGDLQGENGGAGGAGDHPGMIGGFFVAAGGGDGYVSGPGAPGAAPPLSAGGGASGGGGGGINGGQAGTPGQVAGGAGGGGGGQSYADPTATIVPATALGDGSVSFTFTPVATLAAAQNLVFSANPAVAGSQLTITDTVTPPGAVQLTPTGFVTFSLYNVGTGTSTPLWTTPIVNGVATWQTTTLPVGSDYISASYTGDDYYVPSNSPVVNETVNPAPETLSSSLIMFNTQTLGSFTSMAVTITDTGMFNWTPSGFTSSNPDVSVAPWSSCRAGMGYHASCQLVVNYHPTVVGADNATITVTGNFGAITVTVAGTGMGAPQTVGGGGHW